MNLRIRMSKALKTESRCHENQRYHVLFDNSSLRPFTGALSARGGLREKTTHPLSRCDIPRKVKMIPWGTEVCPDW